MSSFAHLGKALYYVYFFRFELKYVNHTHQGRNRCLVEITLRLIGKECQKGFIAIVNVCGTSPKPVVPSEQNILNWIFLSASNLIFTLVTTFSQISHMVPRMDCLFPPNQLGTIIES